MFTPISKSKPGDASHLIVAEYEQDKTDLMTDYFATSTTERIVLGFSNHGKDDFNEMRKAAASSSIPEVKLLANKLLYRPVVVVKSSTDGYYYEGRNYPGMLDFYDRQKFGTMPEAKAYGIKTLRENGYPELAASLEAGTEKVNTGNGVVEIEMGVEPVKIEHREKYSMGHGYYLKASMRYSSGWVVRKVWA